MIELKSKKTGRISVISDEEYSQMKGSPLLAKFQVTQLRSRPIVPSFKQEIPTELKKIKPTKK